jgi:hypothetical protein
MNKKINQFAALCWDERLDGLHFDKEQFAKLIINECVNLCENHSQFLLRFSQFGSNAASDCANIIRDHFNENS